MDISRREFGQTALASLLSFSLIKMLSDASALAGPLASETRPWVLEMSKLTRDMRARSITQMQWQHDLEHLLAKADLNDILRAIDYDALVRRVVFRPLHESVLNVKFQGSGVKGDDLAFDPFFYAMKKGVNIVPHGHRNMATMHMVLAGEVQAVHFDKIAEDRDHIMIKQVSDIVAGPGNASTISDEGTNVHWFKTLTDRVFLFNIGVFSLDPGKGGMTGREYVDPLHGEKDSSGLIRSRRLTDEEAYRLYSGT